ncbi:adenine deaminase C-terminal domain-containing protein [Terrilactibacillus sp. S3-3]|nr:adenine deaminase C-terminal domain-containing protein [Terrilactibacillus sp. S3-3]
MVIVENGTVTSEMALPILGFMSHHELDELMDEAGAFTHELRKKGYKFADPFFSLLFLSSTHLPYIRITPQGLFDVMQRKLLFPNRPLGKA